MSGLLFCGEKTVVFKHEFEFIKAITEEHTDDLLEQAFLKSLICHATSSIKNTLEQELGKENSDRVIYYLISSKKAHLVENGELILKKNTIRFQE